MEVELTEHDVQKAMLYMVAFICLRIDIIIDHARAREHGIRR